MRRRVADTDRYGYSHGDGYGNGRGKCDAHSNGNGNSDANSYVGPEGYSDAETSADSAAKAVVESDVCQMITD